jgi:hypothetical protein
MTNDELTRVNFSLALQVQKLSGDVETLKARLESLEGEKVS